MIVGSGNEVRASGQVLRFPTRNFLHRIPIGPSNFIIPGRAPEKIVQIGEEKKEPGVGAAARLFLSIMYTKGRSGPLGAFFLLTVGFFHKSR